MCGSEAPHPISCGSKEDIVTPNQITVFRVGLALLAIGLFRWNFWAGAVAVVLTAAAIVLDAVDGYVARRTGQTTALGAALDILGDRVVEDSYLIFFAAAGLISFWIPVVFIVRGAATDFLRSVAHGRGMTPFGGSGGMLRTWWGRHLVGSRWSRAAYGILKAVMFCWLGGLILVRLAARDIGAHLSQPTAWSLDVTAAVLTYAALGFCIVRGIPVLWEGRWLLASVDPRNARSAA
jgi:phosphatidylglycerophosphate synthase